MGQLKRQNKSKLIQDKASGADEKPGLELPNLWNLVELLYVTDWAISLLTSWLNESQQVWVLQTAIALTTRLYQFNLLHYYISSLSLILSIKFVTMKTKRKTETIIYIH